MKKHLFILSLAGISLLSSGAENVVFNGASSDAWKFGEITQAADGVLEMKIPVQTEYGYPEFKLDRKKNYILSGEFRVTGGKTLSNLVVGLECLTMTGKSIFPINYLPLQKSSLGTLAEPIKAGAQKMKVSGASGWNITRDHHVVAAFNAEENDSDIPNFNLSPFIKKGGVTDAGNGMIEVEFSSPVKQEIPAGSKIRLHTHGAVFLYVVLQQELNGEWKKISGRIPGTQLRPGSEFGRMVFAFYGKGDAKLQFRNLKVIEE